MMWLAGPLGKVAAWTAAAGAACLALLAAFTGVRRIGQQDQQVADLRKAAADEKVARNVDTELAARSDAAVADELRNKWTRG